MIRYIMDKLAPMFEKGKPLHFAHPAFDAIDTFLYTPKETAKGNVHVRDSLCLKRMMTTVMIALLPCILMATYNTGYQAFRVMKANDATLMRVMMDSAAEKPAVLVDAADRLKADLANPNENLAAQILAENNFPAHYSVARWHQWLYGKLVWLTSGWTVNLPFMDGPGLLNANPGNVLSCLVYGAIFFLPVYIVTFGVGILWEWLFAALRGHEINEGFFVTSLLLPLTLPPTIPLWQVALAITFGVVIAKELFGGTGRNFINPALAARALLFFSSASVICGDGIWFAVDPSVWVTVDGVSGATPLGAALTGGMDGIRQLAVEQNLTEMQYWFNSLVGFIPGSMGETSVICCFLGAALLVYTGIGSWRIMSSLLVSSMVMAFLFYFMYATGVSQNPMYGLYPHWQFTLGGLAFGMVFMATDPVTGAMTYKGQFIYGALIGMLIMIVRCMNTAFPEAVMLAILFGNVCAPLIDYFIVQANIKRRALRNV